ncbi:hypothetical protein KKH05_02495, partial [Patescibacteria group bacterium]|nr:hypothetical protein [Patescibacteria group bacterium]
MKNISKNVAIGMLMAGLVMPGSFLANIQSAVSTNSVKDMQASLKEMTSEYKSLGNDIKSLRQSWKSDKNDETKGMLNNSVKEQLLLLADMSELSLRMVEIKVSQLEPIRMAPIEYASTQERVEELIREVATLRNSIERTDNAKELSSLRKELIQFRATKMNRAIGFAKIDLMAEKIGKLNTIISGTIRPGMSNNGIQDEDLTELVEASDQAIDISVSRYEAAFNVFDELRATGEIVAARALWKQGKSLYRALATDTKSTVVIVKETVALYRAILNEMGGPNTAKPVITYFEVVINRDSIVNNLDDPPQAIAYWESKNTEYCEFVEKMGYSTGKAELQPSGSHAFKPETSGNASFRIDCFSKDGGESESASVSIEIPSKASIEANLVSATAVVTKGVSPNPGENVYPDQGIFEIVMDVTATGEAASISTGFGFGIHGGTDIIEAHTVTSNAGKGGEDQVFIGEGQTVRFNFTVFVSPKSGAAFYNVSLQSIAWGLATSSRLDQMFVIGEAKG